MCVVMCKSLQIQTGNSSSPNSVIVVVVVVVVCINEPGWEPKSGREKNNVCKNGVSGVNFSKYTQNGPSICGS